MMLKALIIILAALPHFSFASNDTSGLEPSVQSESFHDTIASDETPLLIDQMNSIDHVQHYSSEISIKGGSNGVMIVEAKDARISLESGPVLQHIFIEPDVYEVFWNGVLDGQFQYLRIAHCRFFVLYNRTDNRIYAYDWRGKYLVSSQKMHPDELENY